MKYFVLLALFFSTLLSAQIPQYYANIDFSDTPEDIKNQLSQLITNTHTTLLPYTSSQLDTWDVVKQTDEYPFDTDLVYLFYGYDNFDSDQQTDYTRDKSLSCHTSGCVGLWTREHVFAKSLANPSLQTDYPSAGTDAHNLRACDASMNSSRSNRAFQDDSGNAHITQTGHWYPGDEWKGDVARIIMYMYLRYPTQCLPNNTAISNNSFNQDMPDVFLLWNQQDPVSQYEINRNDILENIQGNRNPFIDNPYLATLIWGGYEANDSWNLLSNDSYTFYDFKVYPNPTNDFLYFTNHSNQSFNAIVYDISGKQVLNTKTINKLDISNFEQGFYILKLTNNKNSKAFKFLKN